MTYWPSCFGPMAIHQAMAEWIIHFMAWIKERKRKGWGLIIPFKYLLPIAEKLPTRPPLKCFHYLSIVPSRGKYEPLGGHSRSKTIVVPGKKDKKKKKKKKTKNQRSEVICPTLQSWEKYNWNLSDSKDSANPVYPSTLNFRNCAMKGNMFSHSGDGPPSAPCLWGTVLTIA
jgi:hypothetical protein